MKKIVIIFILLINKESIYANPIAKIDSLKTIYENKLSSLLIKDSSLGNYFSIDREGIAIFPLPESNNIECKIYWNEVDYFNEYIQFNVKKAFQVYQKKGIKKLADSCKNPQPCGIIIAPTNPKSQSKPLNGYKIALDPGHIAGTMKMAKLEGKFIQMEVDGEKIELMEGELTLATALLLKEKLEQAGADVFLTRSQPNQTAFGVSFETWIKNNMPKTITNAVKKGELSIQKKDWLLKKASHQEIFHQYFKNIELIERNRIINQYKPDLTIVIHYNVDEGNTDWKKPVSDNFTMAFVAGAFAKDELKTKEDRFHFLRLLLSNEIEKSINASKEIIQQLHTQLTIPIFTGNKKFKYIQDYSLSTSSIGVYARNLSVTRYTQGIVCYIETLYMDNEKECKELMKKDVNYSLGKTSSRIKEVADAYYQGIINYFQSVEIKK